MSEYVNRRLFLAELAGTGLALSALTATPTPAAEFHPPMSAQAALYELEAGNHRFVEGKPICGPQTARRTALTHAQHPFAIVVGCSDSRVPIETIFDRNPGDIFAVRIAGNISSIDGIASVEYAAAVLKAPLLLVLGHSNCGAVSAAIAYVRHGTRAPGHIQDLVEKIAPAVRTTEHGSKDWLDAAIAANARQTAHQMIADSAILDQAVKSGALAVHTGVYDLASGRVRLLA